LHSAEPAHTIEPMNDPKDIADRYVSIWNEPDADVRRRTIQELWTEDGRHVLQPPEDVRSTAATLGFDAKLEARGHPALEARVARSHEEFVASGQFTFRSRDDAEGLDDVVKFHWEAIDRDGAVAGVGLEFLVLDDDGRIRADYQFIES
jgi:hypothetical protein